MEKLIELINNSINGLNNPKINEKYLDYYNEFKKYKNGIPQSFCYKYEILLYTSLLGIDRFEEINDLFLKCKTFFDEFDNLFNENRDTFNLFFKCLEEINKYNFLNIAKSKEYNKTLKLFNRSKKNFMKCLKNYDSEEVTNSLIKISLLEINKTNFYSSFFDISLVNQYKKLENISIGVSGDFKFASTFKKYLNTVFERIAESNSIILKYYRNTMHNMQDIEQKNNDIKYNYKTLKNLLIKNENEYINNLSSYLELIDDESLKKEVLIYLLIHNSKYNSEITLENESLKSRQVSSMEILFSKYNIDLGNINIEDYSNICDLEKKLKFVSNSNLINLKDKFCFKSLLNLDLENIEFLDLLFSQGIIDEKFIKVNATLLNKNENFNNFKENIIFLNDKSIKEISKYDNKIFMIDNKLLKNRYNLLVNNYNVTLENVHIFEFLKNNEIFDMLDEFIELGYYDQIKSNPNYLNSNNKLMIKRLKITKLIDLNPINSDNSFIGSIISGKDFLVNDANLDEFIIDYTDNYISNSIKGDRISISSSLECFLDFSTYEVSDLIYEFDGIKLSKNRVLRNLSLFENIDQNIILYSLLYKSSNLSEDEIFKIKKCIGYNENVKKMV